MIKFYSDLHKAYLPDFNRCPKCEQILSVGSGLNRAICLNDACEVETVFTFTEEAFNSYFPEREFFVSEDKKLLQEALVQLKALSEKLGNPISENAAISKIEAHLNAR